MLEPDDEHFRTVARKFKEGKITPFLGAGASIADREGSTWEPGHSLPTGRELAAELARRGDYPDTDYDLLRVSQYVEELDLYDWLRALFNAQYRPSSVHCFLAKVAGRLRELDTPRQLIVTTNYDFALETAFDEAGEEYDVVWYEAKRNDPSHGKFWHRAWRPPAERPPHKEPVEPELIEEPNKCVNRFSFDSRTVVLKVHGAVDPYDGTHDSFVIAEDHYIDYLSQGDIAEAIPLQLKLRMDRTNFLFLGYSLSDWNLRVFLNRIFRGRRVDADSWAVQRRPDSEAKVKIEAKLWKRRGEIEPLYAPLDKYIEKLEATVFEAVGVRT